VTNDEKRRLFRQYHEVSSAIHLEWGKRGYQHPPPQSLPYPDELRGLECGAKTRVGTPCKLKDIYINGRCKWHGGCSTGPKTEAGKEQSRINGRKGGRPKVARQWSL